MAQRASQTVRTTFTRGLITEVSELNFPEDASVDELNCDLKLGGSRTKRLGVEYEDFNVLTDETYTEGTLYGTDTWENVGDDSGLEYLVVQTGSKLRFYKKGSPPLSEQIVPISDADPSPYILDLTPYVAPGGLGAGGSHVETTSINGALVVASSNINTIVIERDSDTGVFTVEQIPFKVRDFVWLSDPATRLVESETTEVSRLYDTLNAGWGGEIPGSIFGDTALEVYQSALLGSLFGDTGDVLPALTHPWYSGKNSTGDFSKAEWEKIYSGNSQTANGHFVLDLFNPNRDSASGLTDVKFYDGSPVPSPKGRFATVATYAGRVFYAGPDSKVYFSRIINSTKEFGDLYQVNDPTAEDFSDLLDTDGGWVRIPEAVGIKKLQVFGAALLVFAGNGVWRISGVDDVFRATEFSVFKVSDFGLAFKESFASASNSQPFWWSHIGIHSIEVTETGGMREVNISRPTIESFFNSISDSSKTQVRSAYNSIKNVVYWFYPESTETIGGKLNNALLLDINLGAFYPWRISDKPDGETPYIVGTSFFSGVGSDSITLTVIDSSGNEIVDSSASEVTVDRLASTLSSSEIKLIIRDTTGSLTVGLFSSDTFYDWGTADYEAFATSAYNFIGSMGLKKSSPYITVLLKKDEDYESSCKVSAYWDFKTNPATTPQEAYKETFATGGTVNTNRMRLRGRGRVVTLKFEGSEGKGFDLLGWEALSVSNAGY